MTDHPAVFSQPILERLTQLVDRLDGPVLDLLGPEAGLIHRLGRDDTIGVEIEPEWAAMHPRTIQGDAAALPFPDASFGVVVTSPPYGNRMADQYLGSADNEKCRPCLGTGVVFNGGEGDDCRKCDGTGRAKSTRRGYAISLGHLVDQRSSAGDQWGTRYRYRSEAHLREIRRVLRPGGTFILNISDHVRNGQRQYVTDWWVQTASRLGLAFVTAETVTTRRYGLGQNRGSRIDGEQIVVMEKRPDAVFARGGFISAMVPVSPDELELARLPESMRGRRSRQILDDTARLFGVTE